MTFAHAVGLAFLVAVAGCTVFVGTSDVRRRGPDADASAPDTVPTGPATPGPEIPANSVTLAEFGGVPGASPQAIKDAFAQAFAKLQSLGGGTLTVGAGVYDLGEYSRDVYAVKVDNLRDVFISAYGAKLTMRTTAKVMPVFLRFFNPENVTVAGMSFYDSGTNLSVSWQGAICLDVESDAAHSRFKTVDVLAENVVSLVRSLGNYTFTGFDLKGTVRNAYYGVTTNYSGNFSKVDFVAENVGQAVFALGAQGWDINVNAVAGGPGSNGFVNLVTSEAAPVRDINVNVTMGGKAGIYGGIVHFYHQGPAGTPQHMRNIKANVAYEGVSGAPAMFVFDHASGAGIASSTIRTWEQVELTGSVVGERPALIISNPSVSTGTTNAISVASNLAAFQNIGALPKYFTVK